MRLALTTCLALMLAGCQVSSPRVAPHFPGLYPLTGAVFGDDSDIMVIFLHGDISSMGPADHLYRRAKKLAQSDDVIAVALLRPGYWDRYGRKSIGSNHNRKDHYTAKNNELVAETIANLKTANGISRVIVMGFSGGAAQLGAIIGQRPRLVDVAILAACPCDVKEWRESKNDEWPNSQSPMDFAEYVDSEIVVDALTGSDDDNTYSGLAENFVDALPEHVTITDFNEVEGADHWFSSLESAVMAKIRQRLGGP